MQHLFLQITSFGLGTLLLFGAFTSPVYAVPTLIPVLGVFGAFIIKIVFFGASIAFFSVSAFTKGNRKYYTIAAITCLSIGIILYFYLQ